MRSEIPRELQAQIASHPLAGKCWRRLALHDHECQGRITWEHAIIYAGKRLNEEWAIVMLCAWAHSVDQFQDGEGLNKQINEWIAINRMSVEDEQKYSRRDWAQRRRYLNGLYGPLRLQDEQ